MREQEPKSSVAERQEDPRDVAELLSEDLRRKFFPSDDSEYGVFDGDK